MKHYACVEKKIFNKRKKIKNYKQLMSISNLLSTFPKVKHIIDK